MAAEIDQYADGREQRQRSGRKGVKRRDTHHDRAKQGRFYRVKAIYRKYGRHHRPVMYVMHFFHQPGRVHDSVNDVKMYLVPEC